MQTTFNSLFDIYPDKVYKGAVVGYRKADGNPLEFPCTLDTGDAVKDAKGRWTASGLGLKPVVAEYLDSLRNTKAREAWVGDGFCKDPDDMYFAANSTLECVRFVDDITEIGYCAFQNCWSLESITIPKSVTSIGEEAFINCIALTSVEIPESVTEIGNRAFYSCEGLTSVTIPDSITSIGCYTFVHCTTLTSVEIPESVTEIGEGAFYECFGLTSITIPDSVKKIGNFAFSDCIALTDIYVNQFENGVLDNAEVPAGCTVRWKQTEAV